MYIELDVRFVNKTPCRMYCSLRVVKHIIMLQRHDEFVKDDYD